MFEDKKELEQNVVEVVPVETKDGWKSQLEKAQAMIKKIDRKTAIIVAIIVVVLVVIYIDRGFFIAATVNGKPVSRLSVIDKLEKASGREVLTSIITQELVLSELDKNKITVTDDEVNAEIKTIDDKIVAQGGTMNQVLLAQGMTAADLKNQISINLRLEKLLADKTQVTDVEITQYIKDNKLVATKGQEAQFRDQVAEQIKTQKLSEAAQSWVDGLRAAANIKYFGNY